MYNKYLTSFGGRLYQIFNLLSRKIFWGCGEVVVEWHGRIQEFILGARCEISYTLLLHIAISQRE